MLAVFAGHGTVSARFWLLDAPDNLQNLSRTNPDGAGIGWFDQDGLPHVDRAPIEALDNPVFAQDARRLRSNSLIAHVRHSSGTRRSLENTMPFERAGRIFAHNGALGDLATVEALVGANSYAGDTDSERYLALITRRAAEQADLSRGLAEAVRELAAEVPVLSLNCVIASPDELVALRYPETDTLWILLRGPGAGLHSTGSDGPIRVSGDEADVPHVVVASEPLDDDAGWRPLQPGELVHVSAELEITSTLVRSGRPARILRL